MNKQLVVHVMCMALVSCSTTKQAKKATQTAAKTESAPAPTEVPTAPLKEAFFGETHLHTSVSMDAFIAGTRLSPSDAYRFAKGEEVIVNGKPHSIDRPLDFCAVTDHAEFMGEAYSLRNADAPGYDDPVAKAFREAENLEVALGLYGKYVLKPLSTGESPHPPFFQGDDAIKSTWQENFEATEKHYEPGKFTTIHAYEYTSAPGGGNLHRNVLFRDTNVPEMPFSANDSPDPAKLWEWMAAQREAGRKLFAMPHNANESKGLLFSETTLSGKPLTKQDLDLRASMEPLIEMMQIKGNSEVVPEFWPNDEFADFENARTLQNYNGRVYKKENFVRYGLTRGLKWQADLGVNPFKYGFVGGTDSHNGTPSDVTEDSYVGSHGMADATPQVRATSDLKGEMRVADLNPGAITGVWATANTREAIWDAMNARETFATSGPRIKVRAFAGQGFRSAYDSYRDLVTDGYAKGVPMGGDYASDRAPQVLVWATKDPMGPNLDRIQIIKGWVADGELKDQVFDVVASGDRMAEDGSIAPVDAPIDPTTGQFNREKGSPELMGVWTDPDFDPKQHAYYYVRVLQLPTARWTLYDTIRAGVKYPDDVKKQIVERAWGSPIWYDPR